MKHHGADHREADQPGGDHQGGDHQGDGGRVDVREAGAAWLFCPADRPDRYTKAAERADVVIIDLEDAVAPAAKAGARQALVEHPLDPTRTVVRVNPAGTADHDQDLAALARTDYGTVMLAKAESADQVCGLAPREVVVLVETPRAALAVTELAAAANTVALMWGAEDLVAALGGTASRRPDGGYRDVAQHVRSAVLLAAAAHHRLALDAVHLDIADLDGLADEAADAVAVGFGATVCIHPGQVPVVREAYRPDAEAVRWARAVLDRSKTEGGVFAFAGRMIDAPVLAQARGIIRRAGSAVD